MSAPNNPAVGPVVGETQPKLKRAYAFCDGQNLFHAAQRAFARVYPDYHPVALADMICRRNDWDCLQINFYTGVPSKEDSLYWHNFWAAKRRFMSRDLRVKTFMRDTKYRSVEYSFTDGSDRMYFPDGTPVPEGTKLLLPNGKTAPADFYVIQGTEKGIDVRIAVDLVCQTFSNSFDVGIIFSQDQDLAEATRAVKAIGRSQNRRIDLYSAFPFADSIDNKTPIGDTIAIKINQADYESCLDPSKYRLPR